VKASFAQRRKTLANGLQASFGSCFTKEELSSIITYCGYDEKIRGETLPIEGFAKIANEIGKRLNHDSEKIF
jgi:16S rRNA (adenine1518-N6/adenine1519-N6)-dimethyltransferase